MLLAGDEFGHTQGGDNNAYAQDNTTSWPDWTAARGDLIAAVRDLIAFRRAGAGLADARFARGAGDAGPQEPRATWLHPGGGGMTEDRWQDGGLRALGLLLDLPGRGPLLMLPNAGDDGGFALPPGRPVACDEPAGGEVALGWQTVSVLVPEEAREQSTTPGG